MPAAGILATLIGLDPAAAGALLARCDHDVRTALLRARLELAPDAASARLAAAEGDVRRALSLSTATGIVDPLLDRQPPGTGRAIQHSVVLYPTAHPDRYRW